MPIGKKNNERPAYVWGFPQNDGQNHADKQELPFLNFDDLKQFSDKSGYEKHGIVTDYSIFERVPVPDAENKGKVYPLESVDFRLRNSANVIDKGCRLPNVNDDFTGSGPDLGALEYGQDLPHYGPRDH